MITLATVSPCYNEEDVLERSVERLTELFNRLMAEGTISRDSVMVFVNDGSTDAALVGTTESCDDIRYLAALTIGRRS